MGSDRKRILRRSHPERPHREAAFNTRISRAVDGFAGRAEENRRERKPGRAVSAAGYAALDDRPQSDGNYHHAENDLHAADVFDGTAPHLYRRARISRKYRTHVLRLLHRDLGG